MAKKFMFVCFGILALAAAYAVGAGKSVAQIAGDTVATSSIPIGNTAPVATVVTASGEVYARSGYINSYNGVPVWIGNDGWHNMGNVFTGSTPTDGTTLGGVKSIFR